MPVEMKRCKVYPRNGLQFIPGILEKQKRIEFPAELPLSPHEIRRCLSYADVYEVRDDDSCVLLTMENYLADNSEATAATDVPEDELLYPRDEEDEEEGGEEEEETEEESSVDTQSAQTSKVAAAAKAVSSGSNKQTTSYTKDAEVEAEKNNK